MLSVAALADATRRRIVEVLATGELSSSEIARRFETSPSAISQHLKILKRAYLVQSRVEGQRRIYELSPGGFAELEEWLGGIREYWRRRLGERKRQLYAAGDKRKGRKRSGRVKQR